MMLDMVAKELGRRQSRTTLTIVGVAIGIILVTTLSSFSEGINNMISSNIAFLSGMVVVIQDGTDWGNFALSEIEESLKDDLEGISGVDRVAGVVMGSVPGFGFIVGADPENYDLFGVDTEEYIKEGRVVESGESELMVGSRFSDNTGYKVGDYIEMRGKKYAIVGEMKPTGTEEDNGIVTDLETAKEILRKDEKVTMFLIKPVSVGDARDIADEINRLYDSIMAATDEDARRAAEEFTGQISMMTWGMGSIAAVIAGLGIMNVMFMSVMERRKEIGTMKALGATNTQILSNVVLEAVVISLIGAAAGILLSYLAVDAINIQLGSDGVAMITPTLLVEVVIFAVLLGIFSGLLPAYRASKLEPAIVLRYE